MEEMSNEEEKGNPYPNLQNQRSDQNRDDGYGGRLHNVAMPPFHHIEKQPPSHLRIADSEFGSMPTWTYHTETTLLSNNAVCDFLRRKDAA